MPEAQQKRLKAFFASPVFCTSKFTYDINIAHITPKTPVKRRTMYTGQNPNAAAYGVIAASTPLIAIE